MCGKVAYKDHRHLNGITTKQRVDMFKDTAIDLLNSGRSAEELNDTIELFITDEQYEAVQGIKLAIEEFENNKLK